VLPARHESPRDGKSQKTEEVKTSYEIALQ